MYGVEAGFSAGVSGRNQVTMPGGHTAQAAEKHSQRHAHLVDVDDETVIDQRGAVGLEGERDIEAAGGDGGGGAVEGQRRIVLQGEGGEHRLFRAP